MERLKEAVLRHARNQPEGVPLTAKGLLHLGSRAAIDQTLSRLARSGDLLRAGRGPLCAADRREVRQPGARARKNGRSARDTARRADCE